tara:strand:+ start:594 stop:1133 length:540 start_codon:yes stop_codon:yes gene_type:complete
VGEYKDEIYLDQGVFMDDMSWVNDDEFWRKVYEIAEAQNYVVKNKENTVRIENLTRRQAALCKIIWSCESAEDIANFIITLPESDQRICDGLLQLLNYEFLEEDAKLETFEEFPEVENILKNIKEKYVNGHSNNVYGGTKNGKRQRKIRPASSRFERPTRNAQRKNRSARKKPEPPCET